MDTDNQGFGPLKVYRSSISPTENSGYRSCIVIAESEWEARRTHPSGCSWDEWIIYWKHKLEWVPMFNVDLIHVQEVGTANTDQTPGVLCYHYVQLQSDS